MNRVRLTASEREALDKMRFFRNLWGDRSDGDPKNWFIPEVHRVSVETCDALAEYGFVVSNHITPAEPKNFIGRLIRAIFFPTGVTHRYAITESGMEYANRYIDNLRP